MKVKIIGAGSIGNHLAQASRRKGWEVTVIDIDPAALERMKNDIYPARYGEWDESIQLYTPEQAPKKGFDVIFVGTPPDVRMKVAVEALKEEPKVLQLEKPFFRPMINESSQAEFQTFMDEYKKHSVKVVVGYEYAIGASSCRMAELINSDELGEVKIIEMSVREEWSGALAAHPWLAGPHETYLGFWQRGGGASGEHSHAIHYWQRFAFLLGVGKINKVSAVMKMVSDGQVDHDAVCAMNVQTDKGFIGRIVQDVVTDPPFLSLFIQREKGFIKWIRYGVPGKGNIEKIKFGHKDEEGKWQVQDEETTVKRPDDFYPEICHIDDILQGKEDAQNSPISLESGIHSTKVLTAAHKSRMNDGVLIDI